MPSLTEHLMEVRGDNGGGDTPGAGIRFNRQEVMVVLSGSRSAPPGFNGQEGGDAGSGALLEQVCV